MSYNYFGMTTDAYQRSHPAKEKPHELERFHPLVFITVDKPNQNVSEQGDYLMVVRAQTSSGREMMKPRFVARDKSTLTEDKSRAVHISLGWKYDRKTDWRQVAADAIKAMAALARQTGFPSNCIKEWYE